MKRKQKRSKLIPKVPFTVQEINVLLESKGKDKALQEKLLDFSRSDAYKFLSGLSLSRIKAPLPGVNLTRRESELFNEFVKYKASLDYQIFRIIHTMVNDYSNNLRVLTMKEDFPKTTFKVTDKTDDHGNLVSRTVEEVDNNNRRYRPNLPGIG